MKRRAFTLIELLIVIAIIAILAGLLSAAAMRALMKADEVRTRNEISQLHEAVINFETKYGVDYVPSRIRLLDSGAYDLSLNAAGQPSNLLDFDSFQYLLRLWPRLRFPVDWNGNGSLTDDVTLSGDQCLVFFLSGFSSDQTQPTTGIKNAFYEFQTARLAVGANGYPSYLDPYGVQPYLYFSCYKSQNGYNRYGSSDCANVTPYLQSNAVYWNPTSFQIISAGRDGQFGPGGLWSQGMPVSQPERDDMANFSETLLGN